VVVEPDPVTDDFTGKAMVFVPFGIRGRGHVGYLSWGSVGHLGCLVGVIMSWVEREDQ
jgi:hypothetical protein